MSGFLTGLAGAVETSGPVAGVAAAILWGVFSIILSPCHLASIPLLVGYISRSPDQGTGRAFGISLLFSAGVTAAIAALGALTLGLGRIAGDIGSTGGGILSALMILFGLNLMEVVTIPVPSLAMPKAGGRGRIGPLVYGFVFGAASGPCTFAFIAPLLGVVLAAQASRPVFSAAMMGAFILGHCGVILLAGTFSGSVCRLLHWNERSNGLQLLRRIAGALVVLAGLYLLWKAV